MSAQKRRGLGRGLGALIPAGPEGDRPVDVFFPAGDRAESRDDAPPTDNQSRSATVTDSKGGSPSDRSTSWDAAMSSGRLAIRTNGQTRPAAATSLTEHSDESDEASLGAGEGFSASGVVLVDESNGSDPADLSVVTGPVAAVDTATATVTQVGSIGRPREATPSRAGADAVLSKAGTVSRETDGEPQASDSELLGADDLLPVPGASFAELPVDAIRPNTWQPRTVFDETELDELVDSIKQIGVLQPIVVRPDKTGSGQYELIMGERRWRATQLADHETIPAIIRETDDADMLRDALLENLHRAQLNPLEEAAAYRQLLDDFGCTHEELATRIARSRPQISNTLRLLKLPPLVQRRVAAGILSAGHARALLSLADGAEIERLAQRIVSEGLSVRATEEIVAMHASGEEEAKRRAPRPGQRSVAVDELAGRLSDLFETRVKVQVGKSKGRLMVEFASVEDLNRILAVMAPEDPGLLKQ